MAIAKYPQKEIAAWMQASSGYSFLGVFFSMPATHEECPGPPGTWAIMKKLSVNVMQEHHTSLL